jgi:hypothetical protein
MNSTEALPIWEHSTASHFIQLTIEANYQILAGIIGEELFRLIGQFPTGAYPFQRPELEESNPFHNRYMPGIPTQGITVMVREYLMPGASRPHIENPVLYFRCDALSQNRTRLRAQCPDERLYNIYKHVLDLLRREYGLDAPPTTQRSADALAVTHDKPGAKPIPLYDQAFDMIITHKKPLAEARQWYFEQAGIKSPNEHDRKAFSQAMRTRRKKATK